MKFKIYGKKISTDRSQIKVGSLVKLKNDSYVYQISRTGFGEFGEYNFINLVNGNRFLRQSVDFFELCRNEYFEHVIFGALILVPDDYAFSVDERVEIMVGENKGLQGTIKSVGLSDCNVIIGKVSLAYSFSEIMPAF